MPYPNKNRSALPTVSLRGLTGPRQSAAPTVSLRGAKRRGNLRALTDGTFPLNDTSRRLPRPPWGLAMTDVVGGLRPGSDLLCHCEETVGRRGNPFFWQLVLAGTAYMEYGLPRPLRGLAMTSPVVPAPKRCHCEEAKPTWQSPGTNGRDISAERYFPEIATAPMGPRNDSGSRWSAPYHATSHGPGTAKRLPFCKGSRVAIHSSISRTQPAGSRRRWRNR